MVDEPSIFSDDIVELSSIDFDRDMVWAELVLYAGFLLKSDESLFLSTASTEERNDRAVRILPYFFPESCKNGVMRSYIQAGDYWTPEFLPDVCGACYHTFGLTIEGRYRLSCNLCKGQRQKLAFEVSMDMHRLCPTGITKYVLCQLIYKYYSPNGDPLWQMKKTTNLM